MNLMDIYFAFIMGLSAIVFVAFVVWCVNEIVRDCREMREYETYNRK